MQKSAVSDQQHGHHGHGELVPVYLPHFHAGSKIADIGCGDGFSLALSRDNLIYTWGKDVNTNLSLGDSGLVLGREK